MVERAKQQSAKFNLRKLATFTFAAAATANSSHSSTSNTNESGLRALRKHTKVRGQFKQSNLPVASLPTKQTSPISTVKQNSAEQVLKYIKLNTGQLDRRLQPATCVTATKPAIVHPNAFNATANSVPLIQDISEVRDSRFDVFYGLDGSTTRNVQVPCGKYVASEGSTLVNFQITGTPEEPFVEFIIPVGENILTPGNATILEQAAVAINPACTQSGVSGFVLWDGSPTNLDVGPPIIGVPNESGGLTQLLPLDKTCGTLTPTTAPSQTPSTPPSYRPSINPTTGVTTLVPSKSPSGAPTYIPSTSPSGKPSFVPTFSPSGKPSFNPSNPPSQVITFSPSGQPSVIPSFSPSASPTTPPSPAPSAPPSYVPSVNPTNKATTLVPSHSPSGAPTFIPTLSPSGKPSFVPTFSPSGKPSFNPSNPPSEVITFSPSGQPSVIPSFSPSASPTTATSLAPSPAPSAPPSYVPSVNPTNKATTLVPSHSPSGAPTFIPTISKSGTPSFIPTVTKSGQPSFDPSNPPSAVITFDPSGRPSVIPSFSPSASPTTPPSPAPSAPPSYVPSINPTNKATTLVPSHSPSGEPTYIPTLSPSGKPSFVPTVTKSGQPSFDPSNPPSAVITFDPSGQPSVIPSFSPSASPTTPPSPAPSAQPSYVPSVNPTNKATTLVPSHSPSGAPTFIPTLSPSGKPSFVPTVTKSGQPSFDPSNPPSAVITFDPSGQPSALPSVSPSVSPTAPPSAAPSTAPSFVPSENPTNKVTTMVPSQSPSGEPTYMLKPSRNPSKPPSLVPTFDPKTGEPSFNPTNPPSVVYTKGPSGEPSILPTFHISEAPSEDNQGEQEGGSNRRRNIIIGVSAGLSAGLAAALFCYLRNKNDQPGYEPLAGDSLAGYDEHSLAGYDELSDYDLTELPKDLYPIREEASSRETQASADHDSQQSTSTWVSFVNQIPEFFGLTSSATVPDASEEEEIKVEIASIKSEARQPSIHNSQPHDEARLRHVPTQNNQEDLETGSVSSLSDSGSEHSTRRRTPRSRLRRAVPPTDEHTAVSYAPTNLGVVPQSGDSNRSNASRDYYPFQEARDRIARRLGGETLQDTHSQEDTTSDQGFEIAASGDISFTESRHADDDVNRFITKTNKHYLVGQLTDLIRDFIPKLEGDYQPEAESVFISAVNELIKPIEQADSSETRSRENQHTYEDLSEVITELLTLIEESSVASETQSQSSSVTVSSQLRELVVRLESIYAEPRDRKNTSTERQPAQHQAVAQSILGRADEARQRGYSRIDEESGRIQSPNYHQEALSGLPLFLEGSSSRTIPSGNESVRSDSS